MTLDIRAQELLEMIAAERARGRAGHLDAAHERAEAIRAESHAAAREAVRRTFAAERERCAEQLTAARARLQTAERMHQRHRAGALLGHAWQQLPAALRARWADAAGRSAWVAKLVAAARQALSTGGWRIEHPPGWPAAEREALAASLGFAVQFAADAAIEAGLRIRRNGSVVDGTLAALLADRADIGARLLGLLAQSSGETS